MEILLSEGNMELRYRLVIRGDSLVGKMEYVTDAGIWPIPTTRVRATPVPCADSPSLPLNQG